LMKLWYIIGRQSHIYWWSSSTSLADIFTYIDETLVHHWQTQSHILLMSANDVLELHQYMWLCLPMMYQSFINICEYVCQWCTGISSIYVNMSANDVLEFHQYRNTSSSLADIFTYIDETLVHHWQTYSHILMKL
jgi:hypothetical protein